MYAIQKANKRRRAHFVLFVEIVTKCKPLLLDQYLKTVTSPVERIGEKLRERCENRSRGTTRFQANSDRWVVQIHQSHDPVGEFQHAGQLKIASGFLYFCENVRIVASWMSSKLLRKKFSRHFEHPCYRSDEPSGVICAALTLSRTAP